MITEPQLPPKAGYVEVEVNGVRTYRNISTGELIDDEVPTPTLEEQIAALQAENARKDAQIAALSDYQDFQDELIAEMAAEVYK